MREGGREEETLTDGGRGVDAVCAADATPGIPFSEKQGKIVV